MPVEKPHVVPASSLPLRTEEWQRSCQAIGEEFDLLCLPLQINDRTSTDNEIRAYGSYAKMFAALRARGLEVTDPDDVERRIEERMRTGTITVNEVRELRGLYPVVGGDAVVQVAPPSASAIL
jgi:hypothetical protein